jgi:hypothetical protein
MRGSGPAGEAIRGESGTVTDVKVNDNYQRDLNMLTESTAEAVRMVRDFAGDISHGEAIQALDRVVGQAVRSASDVDRAKGRLNAMRRHVATVGGSMEGWFSTVVDVSDAMQSVGMGGRFGSAVGGVVAHGMAVMRPGEGREEEMKNILTEDITAFTLETPELEQALYGIESSSRLSAPEKDAFRQRLRAAAEQGAPNAMQSEINRIATDVERQTGVSFSTLSDEVGGDFKGSLSIEGSEFLAETSAAHMNARRGFALRRALSRRYSPEEVDEIMEARNSMTSAEFRQLGENDPTTIVGQASRQIEAASGLRRLNNFSNDKDILQARRSAVEDRIARDRAGGGEVYQSGNFGQEFVQSFLKGSNISDAQVVEYLRTQGEPGETQTFSSVEEVNLADLEAQVGQGGSVHLNRTEDGGVQATLMGADKMAEGREAMQQGVEEQLAERLGLEDGFQQSAGLMESMREKLSEFSADDWKQYKAGEGGRVGEFIEAAGYHATTAGVANRLLDEQLNEESGRSFWRRPTVRDEDQREAMAQARAQMSARMVDQTSGGELLQVLQAIDRVVSAVNNRRGR